MRSSRVTCSKILQLFCVQNDPILLQHEATLVLKQPSLCLTQTEGLRFFLFQIKSTEILLWGELCELSSDEKKDCKF